MKKTLALVLTILCGLVAGTIPAPAQSTNATLNSVFIITCAVAYVLNVP